MKAMIRICGLHLGHSKGSISYMRFMHSAQLLFENSRLLSLSCMSGGEGESLARSPRRLQEYLP